ncbi:non-ribosomal peptide synthetase [Micromonospora okii]|uniref:non-ribosomal peptide synthetase n=1 Tax=Micromonospora okii TaxID=1182970 RepID=UPI001E288B58|nr:non-ribosomal peptide synthetase [Micromonospora okii]
MTGRFLEGVADPELRRRVAALSPDQRARFEQALRRRLERPDGLAAASGAGPWRASFGQERMWVAGERSPGDHNYAVAVRLRGQLRLPAFRASVWRVVQRHEVLRTELRLSDEGLMQLVHAAVGARVPLADLTVLAVRPDEPLPPAVRNVLRTEARRPFELRGRPPLRVIVLRFSPTDHCVLVAMHHAATDGWSLSVLLDEIVTGYRDLVAGRTWSAPPLPAQYRDYAAWQRRRLAGPEGAALVEFWRESTRDLTQLRLPADAPRQVLAPGEPIGANHEVVLDSDLSRRLARLHDAQGGTEFMLALTALVVVLATVTGQLDVVLGTLTAGRTRPELERLIGYFVNVLLLRFRLPATASFRQLWTLVREQVTGAYGHQELPYEELLRLLRAEAGSGDAPIRVLCVAHPTEVRAHLPGLRVDTYDVDLGNAPFDLVVELRNRSGELRFVLQYDVRVLTPAAVTVLGEHLRAVLRAALADLDAPWTRLLAPALPHLDSGPPASSHAPEADDTVHGPIEEQARRRPDAVAVIEGDRHLSFRALNRRANQLAWHLCAAGVAPEDRVGVCLPRSAAAVIATLAVLKAGAAYVALDPALPPARLAELAAGLRVIVSTSSFEALLSDPGVDVVWLDRDAAAIAARDAGDLRRPVHADQAAYLVYTSGSTGRPKAVVGTHRGLVNRARWMQATHPVAAGEVCALRVAVGFVDAAWETFGPLRAGGTLDVVAEADAGDPVALADRLARTGAARVVAAPGLLVLLCDAQREVGDRLAGVRTWQVSGEELPAAVALRFRQRLPDAKLLNLYGSAEVAADATAAEVAGPLPVRVPIGRPLHGVTVWVADHLGRAVPALAPGELHVGGAGVARGYDGRPGETAAVFLPDPYGLPGARAYRTGDRGRVRADGQLEFLGRLDRQVQVRGHRVEPAEVEAALLTHPGVRQAVVTARLDGAGSTSLVGYVVPDGTGPVTDPRQLRAFLAGLLPRYSIPARMVALPALPCNRNGKVDHAALPPPETVAAITVDAVAGADGGLRSALEQTVVDAFAEVLGVPTVGRDDDFFLAGGHSILAGQLVRLLGDRLGVTLRLVDLFEAPTAAALAERCASAVPADPGDDSLRPTPAAWHDPFPLTDVQQAYLVGRGDELLLGGVSTHAYLEFHVGRFEASRFGRALNGVVARHPMLRAVLRTDGNQQVLPDVPPYRVAVEDLRGLAPERRAERLSAVRRRMSHQVHAADRWPLFEVRATLLTGPDPAPDAMVHVSIDALICDAYSFGLLMDELNARYRDPVLRLPELTVSFRDYVLHRMAGRGGNGYATALGYWRERLPELPAGPELPVPSQPVPISAPRFSRRSGRLVANRWAAVRDAATTAGLTPSVVLLAAFTEVLTRWSRRPHYSVILTVFDRDPVHPQLGQVVGDFTTLTVLEVDHRRAASFVERARALQRRLWSDLDAGAVSAVTVMREWAAARGLPPDPMTPVVFTSNLPLSASAEAGFPARGDGLGELRYGITQTPQVHLDHQVSEENGELLFNWDTVDDVFPPGVLDDMFTAYRALLDAVADGPTAWGRPLSPPLPAAQATRRAEVNRTAAPLPERCLHDAVVAAAARHPDRIAVLASTRQMTYAELVGHANRVARTLRRSGVGRNRLVAVAAHRGWQQVTATLGVLLSGAAFLPLDPDLPGQRFVALARRGEVDVLLTERTLVDRLPNIPGVAVVAVDDDTSLSRDDRPMAATSSLDDLAYVIFTSGSTGEPKGVTIDHRGSANTVQAVNRRLDVGPEDRVLAVSSLSFDLAVYDLFGILAVGGAVVVPDHHRRADPAHWAQLVRDARVTIWNSVPALAELLAGHAEALDSDALTSLRAVLLSGDWIPVDLPERVRALTGAQVLSLGGATEGSIWSVWYPVGRVESYWRSIPYGKPMPNQTLRVLDAQLRDRPDLVPGELYIGGTGVAVGYWRDDERTADSFIHHPDDGGRLYRTGDLARYLPDGNLEFLGREDTQVKINGYRIELGEIEAVLSRTSEVRAATVIAAGRSRGDRRLVAFLVPADPDRFDVDVVRRRAAEVLPDYLRPTGWIPLERLPLTGNGKVDQAALQRLAAERLAACLAAPATAAAPSGELVETVGGLWRETLGFDAVAPDDNFFLLGGTSLVAIRLLDRIQAVFGVRVPLAQLFAAPTVRGLAESVAGADRSPVVPTAASAFVADPAARFEPFALTDLQQAYWVGRRLGGVATHLYLELDATDLDVPRLERALDRLIDRHDALRTVLRADGQQQVLREVPPYRIGVVDRRAADGTDPQPRHELSHEVRDLGRWPLFELRVERFEQGRSRLHVSLDLLTMDARSLQILTGELLTYYADAHAELPPIGLTFRDYLTAVSRLRRSARYAEDLRYWRSRLAQLPPPPALPLLPAEENGAAPTFTRLTTELDENAWRALRQWAAGADITPSSVVCTVFCQVLAAWSTSPAFTLNLTTFNRLPLHPDVDKLVGDFTATNLLAVELTGGAFLTAARQLQAQLWQDLEHHLVSGVEVQRMLRQEPGVASDGIMPVVFTSTLLPADTPAEGTGPPLATLRYAVSQTPQVLLDHQVTEDEGRLICNWDFVAAAFPPELVETMFAAFEDALGRLAREAGTAVDGGAP